ncbi:hypothetical protein C8T65DRAFT_570540 [Cerioporus squamosus]|nr:hypothetical protein C8T65DRAFT_570540 [Cerioporus squamosus]
MVAPSDDSGTLDHPYLYARVLSVFPVKAYLAGEGGTTDSDEQLLHVLWVCWFELETSAPGGFGTRRLHHLRFAEVNNVNEAFSFISPDKLLRSVHLIPAFAHGRSDSALPGSSIAWRDSDAHDDDIDWNYHYVGMFSDRDLFMRFLGGAVGHQHIQNVTSAQPDFDKPDSEILEDSEAASSGATVHLEQAASDPVEQEIEEDSENDEEADYGYVSSGDEENERENGGATPESRRATTTTSERTLPRAEGYADL